MSEEDSLGLILDQLLEQVEWDVAEAIRICSIPHWFDEKILTFLRGENSPTEWTMEILLLLTDFTFINPIGEHSWAYHELVRDLLLKRWCERENEKRFKELNLRVAHYYRQKKRCKSEVIYHLLAGGDLQGFNLFKQEISNANRLYKYSTAEHLLNLAKEPCIRLSQEQRWHLQFYTGEVASISEHWDEAVQILDSLRNQDLPEALNAKVLARLATTHNRRGDWDKAIELYQKSLKIGEMDSNVRAWTCTSLGILYKKKGMWREARDCQEKAIRIAKQANDLLWEARALNNLGEIEQLEGRLSQAHSFYKRSIKIKEKLGDEFGLMWSYINLGSLNIDQKKWKLASNFLKQALIMSRDLQVSGEEAWALEYLGELHRMKGQYALAAQNYDQGLAICEEINEVFRKANINEKLGRLCKDKGDYAKALIYLDNALKAFKQLKSSEVKKVKRDIKRLRRLLK